MSKIIGVIPARYASSRLPGKPLAEIAGRPMIWWVWRQARQVSSFERVYVATDDERVRVACEEYGIDVVMTSPDHETHVDRLHELSLTVDSELYVCICGDEPLTKPETISQVLPLESSGHDFVARTLMREFTDPAEALDPSNIKVVANADNECLLLTRSMAPFPYKSLSYRFKKLVGIECYSRAALDFFARTPKGDLETIEDITLLRFVERRKPVDLVKTDAYQLGVDTPKDLERVREIIGNAIDAGELVVEEI